MSHIEVDGTLLQADPDIMYSVLPFEWLDYLIFLAIVFSLRKLYTLLKTNSTHWFQSNGAFLSNWCKIIGAPLVQFDPLTRKTSLVPIGRVWVEVGLKIAEIVGQ